MPADLFGLLPVKSSLGQTLDPSMNPSHSAGQFPMSPSHHPVCLSARALGFVHKQEEPRHGGSIATQVAALQASVCLPFPQTKCLAVSLASLGLINCGYLASRARFVSAHHGEE